MKGLKDLHGVLSVYLHSDVSFIMTGFNTGILSFKHSLPWATRGKHKYNSTYWFILLLVHIFSASDFEVFAAEIFFLIPSNPC